MRPLYAKSSFVFSQGSPTLSSFPELHVSPAYGAMQISWKYINIHYFQYASVLNTMNVREYEKKWLHTRLLLIMFFFLRIFASCRQCESTTLMLYQSPFYCQYKEEGWKGKDISTLHILSKNAKTRTRKKKGGRQQEEERHPSRRACSSWVITYVL